MRAKVAEVVLGEGCVVRFARVTEVWEVLAAEGKGVCYREDLTGSRGAVHFVPDPLAQKIRDAVGAALLPHDPAVKEVAP